MRTTTSIAGAALGALLWCFTADAGATAAPAPASVAAPPTATATSAIAGSAAAQPVKRLQAALIVCMRDGKRLGYQGRYRHLDKVVRGAFDFPFISRVVMGTDWAKLDASQQKQLQDALAKLSVSSYAKEFHSYSGERFVADGTRQLGGAELVRFIFHSGHDRIHFDYQMHRDAAGQWKIANVIVDGVSDLALKSGQYRALFVKQGYGALIAWIDKQIATNGGT
ncbi:MAG TPA: ABC transporter substrate-binding protein [Nevskiaceae bacterium]|nr:ABC transporter substrate-binding protein [Nevskiaceae bacterium]